jgi:hypothetical protein
MRSNLLSFVFLISVGLSRASGVDYVAYDEPECVENCLAQLETERDKCFEKQLNYLNYRLVKSVFNIGKSAIYAGMWLERFKNPDPDLFKNVFYDILTDYNESNLIGVINYSKFYNLAENINSKIIYLTNQTIAYDQYPSLSCPVQCTYDLAMWKTLFGLSFSIFVLALVTIGIYSVYLHKQYKLIRNRLKKLNLNKQ